MSSRRGRVLFGPLLYGTLVVAGLILAGLGLWPLWPTWRLVWQVRTYASELSGPSPLVARRAAEKLAQAGPVAVPWLTEAAKDPDVRVRSLAYSTLGDTRPPSKAAVEALIAGLRDDDARARCEAADALGRLGPDAVMAAEALSRALEDGDPVVRLRSARALWRIGGKVREPIATALLSLVAQTTSTNPPVRLDATDVIVKMGGETEERALASLISLLADHAPAVRREAIECLERFGPRARAAIPALDRALCDQDRLVRCLAGLALSEIEGWEKGRARAVLEAMVDDPALSPEMRKPVRWVIHSELVNGSEFSQPVHVLRSVVADMRQAEDRAKIGSPRPSGPEGTEPE